MKTINLKHIWLALATMTGISFLAFQGIAFTCRNNTINGGAMLNVTGTLFCGGGICVGILSLFAQRKLSRLEFWGSVTFASLIIIALSIVYLVGDVHVRD